MAGLLSQANMATYIGGIVCGNCLDVMQTMPENCIDTVITDPPYGLKFMGKEWDHGVPGEPFWIEALRVAKPGAMLLAFGGTRTHHRLMVAIEDAGWEIRDCMMWLYGSGFPKSLDISKAIDKQAGAEREVVGLHSKSGDIKGGRLHAGSNEKGVVVEIPHTAPATDAAKLWDGYGTGLKPAWEPIIVAMKPLDGTFAHNALQHGVAGFNIDGGRIPGGDPSNLNRLGRNYGDSQNGMFVKHAVVGGSNKGRWPANLVLSHTPECREVGTKKVKGSNKGGRNITTRKISPTGWDYTALPPSRPADFDHCDPDGTETVAAWECSEDCPVRLLDEQSGVSRDSYHRRSPAGHNKGSGAALNSFQNKRDTYGGYNETGGASRFFYCAKASTSERNAGLPEGRKNTHPTVKPLKLMEYLCKLTMTPTGGVVLDPFAGSGSTLLVAQNVGREFIGIELDEEHCETARYRLGGTLFSKVATE